MHSSGWLTVDVLLLLGAEIGTIGDTGFGIAYLSIGR